MRLAGANQQAAHALEGRGGDGSQGQRSARGEGGAHGGVGEEGAAEAGGDFGERGAGKQFGRDVMGEIEELGGGLDDDLMGGGIALRGEA